MKTLVVLCVLSWVVACGGSRREAEAPAMDEPAAAVRGAPAPLRRAEINQAVEDGLGALLAHTELAPVQRDGAFVGFAVVRCDTEGALARVGLEPGDVLVAAFGKPIATPDQAQSAFEAMRTAPSIELTVERHGARRTVTTPIRP